LPEGESARGNQIHKQDLVIPGMIMVRAFIFGLLLPEISIFADSPWTMPKQKGRWCR